MQQGLALQSRQFKVLCMFLEEFAQQEGLPRKPAGSPIIGKEICQLVAEHGDAAWLQTYDRGARLNFRCQRIQNSEKQVPGSTKHAEVVQWSSAAQIALWQDHPEPCGFQDFYRCRGCVWKKIVVESVRP